MKHIKKKYQFESLKLPIKEGATPSFVNRSDSETLKETSMIFFNTREHENCTGVLYLCFFVNFLLSI